MSLYVIGASSGMATISVNHGLMLGNGNLAIGNYDLLITPAAKIAGVL